MGGRAKRTGPNPRAKEDRNAEIARRYAAGDPLKVLAAEYGISVCRLREIAVREGAPLRRDQWRKADAAAVVADHQAALSVKKIAAKHVISRQRVHQILDAARVRVKRSP